MRKETREYKFDWMLWSMFCGGSKAEKRHREGIPGTC